MGVGSNSQANLLISLLVLSLVRPPTAARMTIPEFASYDTACVKAGRDISSMTVLPKRPCPGSGQSYSIVVFLPAGLAPALHRPPPKCGNSKICLR